MTETGTSTRITEVGRVIVPVSDQDRAIDFYIGKLGFEKRADIPYGDGNRWVEVGPPGAPTAIAVVLPREGDSAGGRETGIALTSDDIDADHAELRTRGVDVDPEVMRMGGPVPPMFWLRDQDGNSLLVVQRGS
jgi:catechol 2,3-dioxygenase-like lactoylglutathione lyase family enzyme